MKQPMKQSKKTPFEPNVVDAIQFCVPSREKIQSYSVLEITEQYFYQNDRPVKGGLFDLRLGITNFNQKCQTCSQKSQCPGHFGHIKLNEPVFHIGFLQSICKILKCVCHRCFRLKRKKDQKAKIKLKQIKRMIDPQRKLILLSQILAGTTKCNQSNQQDMFDKNFKPCGGLSPSKIFIKNYKLAYQDQFKKTSYFERNHVIDILRTISCYEPQIQIMGFTLTKPIDLVIQSLLVPPPQMRPHVLIKGQVKHEDDLTHAYHKIIKLNKQLLSSKIKYSERNQIIDNIQKIISLIMMKLRNNQKNSQRNIKTKKKKEINKIKSISQRLQGKQGRFRQNLLGKRVDFCARTVITPDPNLDLNQIGIPQNIVKGLTYPQKVTIMNYQQIVDLCLQGKVRYLISSPEQNLRNQQVAINVSKILAKDREEMSSYINIGMIAQRSIVNGDYVLVNRQPTLHRMSMMAHRIKILPSNTFRINLSVCMPYNADFDGDQMNIHIPQSYQSVSQLKNISSVENQIVGPKNGTTTMGFTQDSLLGACLISSKQTFLNKLQLMNLIMHIYQNDNSAQSILDRIPMPSIIKPQPLWTGKQLLSLIFPKTIQIRSFKQKTKQQNLLNINQISLIIKKGQIISGKLQKQFIGASSSLNNIIHSIWMEQGPQSTQIFMNNFQKITINWLTSYGFSIGASDIVPQKQITQMKLKQQQIVNKLYYNSLNQFRSKQQIKTKHLHQKGRKVLNSFELNVNLRLNNQLSRIQQTVKLCNKASFNNIYRIIQSKSKGSQTNLAQIIYSVGNQNINGQRCPQGFIKRSLPHFLKDDNSPIARGYVVSSFYEGLKPHELFFHSMGGRQGLSDTAIKTSRVGYMQRKIIKQLQNLIVNYDSSVRDCRGNLIQKIYGEDGFLSEKIERQKCFGVQSNKMKFRQLFKWQEKELSKTYHYKANEIKKIKKQYTLIYKNRKQFRNLFCTNVQSPNFQYYCPISIQRIVHKIKLNQSSKQSKSKKEQFLQPLYVIQHVQKLLQQCVITSQMCLGYLNQKKVQKNEQQLEYQSFSDQFQRQDLQNQKQYNNRQKFKQESQFQIFRMHLRFNLSSKILIKFHRLSVVQFQKLISQIKQKYFKSLAPAGQAVGCLAGQSIGQPTTQMTLNTFHLAGISDKNVTLGLPRLQQLLNCAAVNKQSAKQQAYLTIYPKHPILYSQSKKPQIQSYLLDLLIYQLPEHRIGDFVLSTNYSFKPKQLEQIQKDLNTIKNARRTAFKIQFVFSYVKLSSNKIWKQISRKIEKKCYKLYQIDDIDDYNDFSERQQNPKIILRLIQSSSVYNQQLQNFKASKNESKVLNLLQYIESSIKDIKVGGIDGIKSVKLSKRSLCLDQKQDQNVGSKQYVVFQAHGNGSNLKNCLQHPQINSIKTSSNNIAQIYNTLGIEAARQALINEFKQVLKPYGIEINYRHLSVLCDYMCSRGFLVPINRNGLNKLKNISTFTKASFQTATKILLNSALFSTKDQLKDISQKIIFGQLAPSGTSQCQIILDVQNSLNFTYKPELSVKKIAETSLKIQKTPIYDQFITNDNSILSPNPSTYSRLNQSFAKSPGLHLSPNPGFSPTYSPIYQNNNLQNKSISPRYAKDYLSSRATSPLYQGNRGISYGNVSPSYANLRDGARGASPNYYQGRYTGSQLKTRKKQEQEDNQDTQRTLFRENQTTNHKQQDQF